MARKRMFHEEIIDADKFIDLSIEAQTLYFHLSLRADDEGFLASVNKMVRMLRIDKEHIAELQDAEFIHVFASGICLIRHWHIHNTLRKDRTIETIYQEEKRRVYLDKRKVYMLAQGEQLTINSCNDVEVASESTEEDYQNIEMTDKCPSSVRQMSAQERVGKDSIDKDSIDKERVDEKNSLSAAHIRCKQLLSDTNLKIPYSKSSKALKDYIVMMDYECIQYAIEEAKTHDKHSLGYIRAILERLIAEGVVTKDKLKDNVRIRHGPRANNVNEGVIGEGLTQADYDEILERAQEI